MVETVQVTYEHTAGNTLAFPTDDLTIKINRLFFEIVARPDGVLKVIDPTVIQREFSCSAIIDGDDWKILHDWETAAIDYTGGYPRLTTVYLDADTTLTNIEVAIVPPVQATDLGNGQWRVTITFREKSA